MMMKTVTSGVPAVRCPAYANGPALTWPRVVCVSDGVDINSNNNNLNDDSIKKTANSTLSMQTWDLQGY